MFYKIIYYNSKLFRLFSVYKLINFIFILKIFSRKYLNSKKINFHLLIFNLKYKFKNF
jgi:hypothetical protein